MRLVETRARGDASDLAEALGGGYERVIAVGGDGTLNEVLTGLLREGLPAERRPALGFLPGGTANVATRAFGFRAAPTDLVRTLEDIRGRPVDVGFAQVGDVERPFLLWCGAGLDAVVIDRLNSARTGHMGRIGLVLNAPGVASAVARYDGPDVELEIDGDPVPSAGSVILANVRDIAFGGTIHPGASPFDGVVDVVMMDRPGPLALAGLVGRLLGPGLTSARGVRHRAGAVVRMWSEGRVPVQIDGEPVGHLPVSVRIEPAAIDLLVT